MSDCIRVRDKGIAIRLQVQRILFSPWGSPTNRLPIGIRVQLSLCVLNMRVLHSTPLTYYSIAYGHSSMSAGAVQFIHAQSPAHDKSCMHIEKKIVKNNTRMSVMIFEQFGQLVAESKSIGTSTLADHVGWKGSTFPLRTDAAICVAIQIDDMHMHVE